MSGENRAVHNLYGLVHVSADCNHYFHFWLVNLAEQRSHRLVL